MGLQQYLEHRGTDYKKIQSAVPQKKRRLASKGSEPSSLIMRNIE